MNLDETASPDHPARAVILRCLSACDRAVGRSVTRGSAAVVVVLAMASGCGGTAPPTVLTPHATASLCSPSPRPPDDRPSALADEITNVRAFLRVTTTHDPRHGDALARLAALLLDDADRSMRNAAARDPHVGRLHRREEPAPPHLPESDMERAEPERATDDIASEPLPPRRADDLDALDAAARRDVLHADERVAEAIGTYRRLSEISGHPLHPFALLMIASLLEDQGQSHRAATLWVQIARDPDRALDRAYAMMAVGDTARADGRWPDAQRLYFAALTNADDSLRPTLEFRLAVATAHVGDPAGALTALQRAASGDPARLRAIARMFPTLYAAAHTPVRGDEARAFVTAMASDASAQTDLLGALAEKLLFDARGNEAVDVAQTIVRNDPTHGCDSLRAVLASAQARGNQAVIAQLTRLASTCPR